MIRKIISILNNHVPVKRWKKNDIVRAHHKGKSTTDKPARFSHFLEKLDIVKPRKPLEIKILEYRTT